MVNEDACTMFIVIMNRCCARDDTSIYSKVNDEAIRGKEIGQRGEKPEQRDKWERERGCVWVLVVHGGNLQLRLIRR